jgi:hypothetical protein
MKRIFNSSFKYTPSLKTDVRKTFDRIRREQRAKIAGWTGAPRSDTKVNVLPLVLLNKKGA